MRNLAFLLLLLCAFTVSSQAADAAPCAVLLDVSGSMAGFVSGSAGPGEAPGARYVRLLDRLQQICTDGYMFGDPDPRVPGSKSGSFVVPATGALSGVMPNNHNTWLGTAMSRWFASPASETTTIVVTDNVADESSTSQAEQELFTRTITQDGVTGLTLLPVILPFAGPVYDPRDMVQPQRYRQPRALAVYVVHRGAAADYEATVRKVVSAVSSTVVSEHDYQIIQIRPLFAYSKPTTTANSVSTDDARISAELVPDGISIKPHPLDKTWTMTLAVTLRAPKEWEALSTVTAEMTVDSEMKGYLTPTKLFPKIEPTGPVHFVDGKPVVIHIIVPIGAMDYKSDVRLFPILLRLLKGQGSVPTPGSLVIHVAFQSADIKLSPQLAQQWSYCGDSRRLAEPNADVQTKIYCLDKIAQNMVMAAQRYETPDVFRIYSTALLPRWPLYGFVAALLMLAGTLAAFLIVAGRRREFDVVNDMGETRQVSLAFGGVAALVSQDEKVRASARRFVFFFLVSSRQRIGRGKILWGDKGGTVHIADGKSPGLAGRIDAAMRSVGGSRRGDAADDVYASEPPNTVLTYDVRIVAHNRNSASRASTTEDPNDIL